MKSIPYGRQFIDQADIDAVVETLKSDYLTQGPKVVEFEEKFAQYVGAKYAVAVSNGTAGLHLSAMALGVKEGSKVITTPITFAASANSILYCGGEVDFVDIDKQLFEVQSKAEETSVKTIFDLCVQNNYYITELTPTEKKLEDIFRQLTLH